MSETTGNQPHATPARGRRIDRSENPRSTVEGRWRRAEGASARLVDSLPFAAGDQRPNSGLREGAVSHEDVNETLRSCGMTVIFGQQTRMRNGVLMTDRRLPRFHAGHDMVKFFYGAIRQLPDYLVTALLEMNVSISMVEGPDLLVFHGPREHQSFHTGRTRRTIYMPEPVLRKAFELGYDYWAISEVIIQESWPLLDYLLLMELVRRCQDHYKTHYTLGYYLIKDTLRRLNQHRMDDEDRDEDEFRQFFRFYREELYDLKRDIVDRDPYDVADGIYDENRERFWAQLKLHDISQTYRFPTYFHIDRDIVHGAAFRIARELAMPLEPETTADIMHDLWDEARFKLRLSVKTEDLLEILVAMGAEGISDFLETVAEEHVFGFEYVTTNRYDGFDVFGNFRKMLQGYSTSDVAEVPGCLGFDFNRLYQYFVQSKRCELFEQFKSRSGEEQREYSYQMKQMLFRVIEVRLHPDRAPDFKQRVEFTDSARVLIETGEELLLPDTEDVRATHVCGILARLDRHPLYHTEFLRQYRDLSGCADMLLKENIQVEVERLAAYLPDKPYNYSSDPQGVHGRLLEFQQLRKHDPDSKQLFGLLASLFVRLDRCERYDEVVEQTRGLGVYARERLEEIVANDEVFDDEERTVIRETAQRLLSEMDG